MRKPFIVVDIGCLECHNPSFYAGRYRTVADAKKAWPNARTIQERRNMTWKGEGVTVIFDLRRPTPNPYANWSDIS